MPEVPDARVDARLNEIEGKVDNLAREIAALRDAIPGRDRDSSEILEHQLSVTNTKLENLAARQSKGGISEARVRELINTQRAADITGIAEAVKEQIERSRDGITEHIDSTLVRAQTSAAKAKQAAAMNVESAGDFVEFACATFGS